MINSHAVLSASASHRWLHCTPSARLELEFDDRTSTAAEEGTAAHALAEHKLRKALKLRSDKPCSVFETDEMDALTDNYCTFVLETLAEIKQKCNDPIVLIEQHLDFSCFVPEGFGTGDCVIIADGKLQVIDFKYGLGVLVDAENNPQMMLYALGALNQFEDIYDVKQVAMTIYQPRRDNLTTWTIAVSQLKEWAEKELIPKAKLAWTGEGEYYTGSWCQFCRAAVKCRARTEEKMSLVKYEFTRPPILTDADIADILPLIDDLTKWASDIWAYATESAANSGKEWPGFKVVEGRSNRKFVDEEAAAEAARQHGYHDIYKKSLITLTEMEKLMGKKEFQEALGSLVVKPRGKLTLVPKSDKRMAVDTAAAKSDFSEFMEK